MEDIKLGCKGKDRVTGFEGTITARFEYLNGCIRYLIETPGKEGGKPEELIFDEERIEVTEPVSDEWAHVEDRLDRTPPPEEAEPKADRVLARTGGDRPAPTR